MDRQSLFEEYKRLDAKLTSFRVKWNKRAMKDLEKAHRGIPTKPQGDYPDWWYRDVAQWRQLKAELGIR